MPVSRKVLGALALAGSTLLTTNAFAAAADATGIWLDDTGRGAIEIKTCGKALCGHVVWVKDAADQKGCGHQIIGNVQAVSQGVWDNGWIYDPERDSKYDVELKMLKGDKLKVTGYAGVKFLSQSMIWTRAPADLARCDGGTTTASATTTAPATAKPIETGSVTAPATATAAAPAPGTAPTASAPAADEGTEVASADDGKGKLDISSLSDKLGDVISRSPNGKCNLDLPWVKLTFDCDKAKKD